MDDWGSLYLDHYEKFMRQPIRREVFEAPGVDHSIQILTYDNVFPACLVFASLGFSWHRGPGGERVEVVVGADGGFEAVPFLLGATLLYFAFNKEPVGTGTSKGGLADLDGSFVERYKKTAFYFTEPFPFPGGFARVRGADGEGRVLLATFISQEEYTLCRGYGAEQLEEELERHDVDPFCISREPVVAGLPNEGFS